jgi:hypothetical protein
VLEEMADAGDAADFDEEIPPVKFECKFVLDE